MPKHLKNQTKRKTQRRPKSSKSLLQECNKTKPIIENKKIIILKIIIKMLKM